MLTSAQEQVIAATAPVVAEHLDAITQRFYPLMFDRYPEVKSLFNQTHQQNGGQPKALAGAILAYVQVRQNQETARQIMETVVNKHISLDIQPNQYPIVGECLMEAIGQVLGEAVTAEVADAWGALYQELAGLLIELEEQRYQEFEQRPGGWRSARRFHIEKTQQESSVIRSFILVPEDGGPVANYTPGQYIGVKLMIDGEPAHRHYSLSGMPDGRSYRLSIKREPHGLASRYFHDHLNVGDTIELLPPAGELTLVAGDEPLLLISGGIGQTPLLPIAQEALQQGRKVIYLHAAIDAEHRAFAQTLQELAQAYPQQLSVVTVLEQDDSGDYQGRINDELLAKHIVPGVRCYFVGPHGFMKVVDESLTRLGVPESHRHFEHFGPAKALNAA